MKIIQFALFTLAAFAVASRADAALFASSAAGGPGELYKLNPNTGAVVQDIGPLNDGTGGNYPITGLAFHPTTGVLYGSTGNSEAAAAAKLVTINPATGLVTVVGSFNAGPTNSSGTPATMADISFDAAGNLYGAASIGGPQLYSINQATGQATVIGGTGLTSTSGGGLAINAAGAIYGTPTSTRFGTYALGTGAFTNIVNPTKPLGGAYAALDFNAAGVLHGINLGPGPALETRLVTFDLVTGAVTVKGASGAALDAIAFQVPEPAGVTLALSAALAGMAIGRRK